MKRASIILFSPDDEPVVAGTKALEQFATYGLIDNDFTIVLSCANAAVLTFEDLQFQDWLKKLQSDAEIQVITIASFALEYEKVKPLAEFSTDLANQIIRHGTSPNKHRYYFTEYPDLDATVTNSNFLNSDLRDFFAQDAVNLLIPAIDQISSSTKPVPIHWDESSLEFGWHIATETAALTEILTIQQNDSERLSPVGVGIDQASIRYARSWLRGICLRANDADTYDILQLPLPAAFQANNLGDTDSMDKAAQELCDILDGENYDRVNEPQFDLPKIVFLEATGRALARIPSVISASMRSFFKDVRDTLIYASSEDILGDSFQDGEKSNQQSAMTYHNSETGAVNLTLDNPTVDQVVENILGVIDGGGQAAATAARSALGSERKVLVDMDMLTSGDLPESNDDLKNDDPEEDTGEEDSQASLFTKIFSCFQSRLIEKQNRLKSSEDDLEKFLECEKDPESTGLTRSTKALPTGILLLWVLVFIEFTSIRGVFDIESAVTRGRVFFAISIIAFWAMMLPFKPKQSGMSNYLITLGISGAIPFAVLFVAIEEVEALRHWGFGLLVVLLLAALLLLNLYAGNKNWAPKYRVALWMGFFYFYALLAALLSMQSANDFIQERSDQIIIAALIVSLLLLPIFLRNFVTTFTDAETERKWSGQMRRYYEENVRKHRQSLRYFENINDAFNSSFDVLRYILEFHSTNNEVSSSVVISPPNRLGKLKLRETVEANSALRAGWLSASYWAAVKSYHESNYDLEQQSGTQIKLNNDVKDFAQRLKAGEFDKDLRESNPSPKLLLTDTEWLSEIKPSTLNGKHALTVGPPTGILEAEGPVWREPASVTQKEYTWYLSYRFDVSEPKLLSELMVL